MSVSKKKYWVWGLLLATAAVIVVIQFNATKEKVYTLGLSRIDRLEAMRASLMDKKLTALHEIVNENQQPSVKVKIIAYYNTSDCPTCVNKMMETIAEIEAAHPALPVYAISNDLDNMNALVQNNIDAPFFVDESNKFQQWINYSYSPALFYVDDMNTIKEVYHVTTPLYEQGRKHFIEFLQ